MVDRQARNKVVSLRSVPDGDLAERTFDECSVWRNGAMLASGMPAATSVSHTCCSVDARLVNAD